MTDIWDYVFWYCVMVLAIALLIKTNKNPKSTYTGPKRRCTDCDPESFLDK